MAAVHAMRWSMGGVEGLRWWGMRYYNFGGMHFRGGLMGGWWCIQEAHGMGLGHGVWGQWALIGAFRKDHHSSETVNNKNRTKCILVHALEVPSPLTYARPIPLSRSQIGELEDEVKGQTDRLVSSASSRAAAEEPPQQPGESSDQWIVWGQAHFMA